MAVFLRPFDGFVKEDFEIYSPDKWSSNLFNLQRMQVKQKLEGLAGLLQPRVEPWNWDREHETSSERPSIWNHNRVDAQWLYLFRNAKAQKELQAILDRERSIAENIDDPAHHHRHIVLAVRIDRQGLAVLCGLHRSAWLDRRNLQQKWGIPHEKARLLAHLKEIPDSRVVWISSDKQFPLRDVSGPTLDPILTQADRIDDWIALEAQFSSLYPGLQTQDFALEVATLCEQYLPFYRFCAWTKTNDFLSMAKVVSEEKKAKRRSGKTPFEENDVVTIVGGLFAGRTGVVHGYDRAGKVKVKVGNLTLPVNAGSLKLAPKP